VIIIPLVLYNNPKTTQNNQHLYYHYWLALPHHVIYVQIGIKMSNCTPKNLLVHEDLYNSDNLYDTNNSDTYS